MTQIVLKINNSNIHTTAAC